MNLKNYLKDRSAAYIINIITLILVLIFLYVFRVSMQAVVIISVILFIGTLCAELWNFLRKKDYYSKLLNDLERLDKKYLISEMTEEPNFYDGKLLFDIMQETNKSMCENISSYRHENSEFREYIELWVHEIKLPVAGLQLMCHNDSNKKYSEQLKRIDDYIENVLYYARSRNAEKDYIIKQVSLKRVFTETALKNREELQQRGIALSTDLLDTEVMTDAKWLGFIFGQLINNSIKYGADEISVRAEVSSEQTVLRFRDNGIGIPDADLPYIFEKSFTGENGRTHSKSTGMGLYIIKKLCGKLGHSISADSVQGEYTEIAISFGKNDMYDVK